MHPELWQSCSDIFNAAVEQPREQRGALLERSCNGDTALRSKVELLLRYHEKSDDFMKTPAYEVAPELLVDEPDALSGQYLGCYRIERILGAGGMGVVYLACDDRLGRKVALKLLPQPLLGKEAHFERLKREARTASALNHPNIMTIHEVGEVDSTHYIATEFIEGITLREKISKGPLPPKDALNIATQIARALSAAHGAGIVHRDIKPENIMLRPDGFVKVLDFGIAKWTEQSTPGGEVIGTRLYMSPEQTRGETVDARSDLWSLGVVLYEMVAGAPPFDAKTPTDVLAAVLLKDPEPVEQRTAIVPPALQRVVERSLRKDPTERYQTAEEMRSELRAIEEHAVAGVSASGYNRVRWIGGAAVAALFVSLGLYFGWRERHVARESASAVVEKGIAVLPFENLSTEKDDAFFANGIQDDVLTSVGKIKDLKVIARASVMDYGGARLAGKVREIGHSLGVSHVLEGSVRRVADRVVMNVALIDTRDERQVWSERYERTLTDTSALQGELAVEIARALQARLTPAEAAVAAAKPTENPEAYLLYLRAREIEFAGPSDEEPRAAAQIYQQAVDLDPAFALARARLSLCASLNLTANWPPTPEWTAKARAEAEEALRLRPDLGEAHLALAQYYLWGESDYDRALAELNRTAELLPNSAEVPLTAAFIYKRQNRFRDRIAALQRAEALDPRNRIVLCYMTNTRRWLREWPEAMQTFDKIVAMAPREAREARAKWRWWRVCDEFQRAGDIAALKQGLAKLAPDSDCLNFARYETVMLERDYTQAAQHLAAVSPERFQDEELYGHSKVFYEALIAVVSDADAGAKQQALEAARIDTEGRLLDPSDGFPNGKAEADLAIIDAFLGRKEDAIREALRAAELTEEGSIERNGLSSALAMVYAQTGEPEKAIDLIEHLLTVPTDLQRGAVYNMTLTDLKWRWVWDPLRSHPRFQKILAGPEPKTIY